MGHRRWSVLCLSLLIVLSIPTLPFASALAAPPEAPRTVSAKPASEQPITITAERIEYLKDMDVYEAAGSVVIKQGTLQLTADRVTIYMLSGLLIATGKAHLSDPGSDLRAERLEMDVNTNAGVVTNGTLFVRDSNTLISGRLLQRFSEDHFRAKEGSFTNCDAQEGQVPAWRFTFKDLDLDVGDSLYAKDLWLCVNDIRLVPVPTLVYPIQSDRKSGLLTPIAGYDNRFGAHYRQGYFWAMTPSQDMTITPYYLSDRGYGADFEYRYVINRQSKGQWLVTTIQDNEAKKFRATFTGSHVQIVNPDLSIRSKVNYLTDRTIYENLSNSGVLRALPSAESILNINQRFTAGSVYVTGLYLQPVGVGGEDTFQRLPELGVSLANLAPFYGPLRVGLDTTGVYWYREQGFTLGRVDVMPTLTTEMLSVGHVLGLKPSLRLRGVGYTRGVSTEQFVNRETLWASLSASSRLTRRFSLEEGGSLLHTFEPNVVYEYVPASDQSQIVQIDAVDDLPKKNLITYGVVSKLLKQGSAGTTNWLDLRIFQSYHVGSVQTSATQFIPAVTPPAGTITQPLQPATTPVDGKKLSDIWARAVIGSPPTQIGPLPAVTSSLTTDSFFDVYRGTFSQWNTDLRFQHDNLWYVEIGQRYTNGGNRVRRGDIWNPLSFGEVFAPTPEVLYMTTTAAFRTPLGWTIGAKSYYDIKDGSAPEIDLVALYQNPCRCWSLGLYFLKFPDRQQYNFLLSLTGLGASEGIGGQVMRAILGPLLVGERGLPWSAPFIKKAAMTQQPPAQPAPAPP
jgi:LPS-assembly protein